MSATRHMPTMDAIVGWWREHVRDTEAEPPLRSDVPIGDLPRLSAYWIGWGEPFCFPCGWLPPVRDGRADSWRLATCWLDRAHLQDHCVASDDSPRNLVPLCHLCHDAMPEFGSRDEALAWVTARPGVDFGWQAWTDARLAGRRDVSRTTTLFRQRAMYLERLLAAEPDPEAVR